MKKSLLTLTVALALAVPVYADQPEPGCFPCDVSSAIVYYWRIAMSSFGNWFQLP